MKPIYKFLILAVLLCATVGMASAQYIGGSILYPPSTWNIPPTVNASGVYPPSTAIILAQGSFIPTNATSLTLHWVDGYTNGVFSETLINGIGDSDQLTYYNSSGGSKFSYVNGGKWSGTDSLATFNTAAIPNGSAIAMSDSHSGNTIWYMWRIGGALPNASFSATPPSGYAPLSVQFNDTTNPGFGATTWLWNFGDGYTSTLQNPTHAYAYVGNYSVSLAVSGPYGSSTATAQETVLNPSKYYLGVNVVDAATSNPVFTSYLASAAVSDGLYYNNTNNYAFFNVTGTGSYGSNPLYLGELLDLQAGAPGYAMQDKPWTVDQTTGANGFPISIAIAPLSIVNISGQTTVIANVQDNTTHAELANALVSIQPSNPANASQTKYTSSAGIATFTNFSAADSLTITVSLNGYSTQTKTIDAQVGGTFNEQFNMLSTSSSGYLLTLSPTTGTTVQVFSEQFTVASTGGNINTIQNLSQFQLVQKLYSNGLSIFQPVYSTVTNKPINYQLIGSNWYQYYNGSYTNIGATLPVSDTFNVTYGIPSYILPTGNYLALYTIYNPATNITGSVAASINLTNATIGSGIQQPINVVDSSSGNLIGNANIGLLDVTSSGPGWANVTTVTGSYTYTGSGPNQLVPLNIGDTYEIQATATGYNPNTVTYVFQFAGLTQTIPLTSTFYNPPAGEFTAQINVVDSVLNQPISPATVIVSNSTYSKTSTTNSGGNVIFTGLVSGTNYKLTVSSVGYASQSQYITGSSAQMEQITVKLSILTATQTVTGVATVTTISQVTTIPTVTITPAGNGTYTGLWGPFEGLGAAMGAQSNEIALWMAVFLVLFGALVGLSVPMTMGGPASVTGAFVGGLLGFFVAGMAGFVNIIFVVIFAVFMFFMYIFFGR